MRHSDGTVIRIDTAAVRAAVAGGPAADPQGITAMTEGHSVIVYRLRKGSRAFYLRILPAAGQTFCSEAAVHVALRAIGACLPAVLAVHPCHPAVNRSTMLTESLPGKSIKGEPARVAGGVLRRAGRDLALVNALPVAGFGWVARDRRALAAPLPTERSLLLAEAPADLAVLSGSLAPPQAGASADAVAAARGLLVATRATLAHGDFKPRHIFAASGTYSGLIDLSAMRGTGPLFDLAWFAMCDPDGDLLPPVLDGYREVADLPPDWEVRLPLLCILQCVHALADAVRFGGAPRSHGAYRVLSRMLRALATV